ncbi:MAG: hypothetical protein JOZ90_16410 [Alphaproteobacteria bacterium]|nr:hypothetical protein [Alphaproteobacteria bacterium]MBV9372037.1 hypothetical protein [Alphaproteobacteria bacterium]MBV9902653.1 hypothetical protein [Alphaproteobacteria bacterium]
MATALLNERPDPVTQPARNDHTPIRPGMEDVEPQRYVIREISFLMDSDGLQFLYRDPGRAVAIGSSEIRGIVPTLMASSFPSSLGLTGAGLGTAETPLDLGLRGEDGPAYIVFKLDQRLNWRFSQSLPAVTHKREEEAQFYGGLTYVDDAGKIYTAPIESCRLIFFTANPPAKDYRHGFNFNVELIQKPHVDDDAPRILPIMIDPDIRFPGGSST